MPTSRAASRLAESILHGCVHGCCADELPDEWSSLVKLEDLRLDGNSFRRNIPEVNPEAVVMLFLGN